MRATPRGESVTVGRVWAELRSTWTGLATIFTRAVSTGAEREDFFGMKRCYIAAGAAEARGGHEVMVNECKGDVTTTIAVQS